VAVVGVAALVDAAALVRRARIVEFGDFSSDVFRIVPVRHVARQLAPRWLYQAIRKLRVVFCYHLFNQTSVDCRLEAYVR
jgi:hypothetical protein